MKKRLFTLLSILCVVFCFAGCTKTKIVVHEDYQGPILPLTAISETDGITAERFIKCDYSDYDYSSNYNRKVKIHDRYVLSNTTDEDVVMELAYGYVADYASPVEMKPQMRVEGNSAKAEVVVGRSALAYGFDRNKAGYTLYNRERFEKLLQEEVYLEDTFRDAAEDPMFTETVTVYKFEDVSYPYDEEDVNPVGELRFKFDSEKTEVYSFGMNKLSEKGGITSLGFSFPERGTSLGKDVYVIVAGDEIQIEDIKYYRNSMSSKQMDDIDLKYITYETTLQEVLEEIVNNNQMFDFPLVKHGGIFYDGLSPQQILAVGMQNIVDTKEYDVKSTFALEDYLFNLYGDWRVCYQTAEVTVPANDSLEVLMVYSKYTGIKNINDVNYDGLEIMKNLGSNLEFTSQNMKVVGIDKLNVSEHTTGEDLEKGQYEAELDKDYFEIYLEVPEKEHKSQGWWNRKP